MTDTTITLPRSVVEQALEAFEAWDARGRLRVMNALRVALRAALERPAEQESMRVFFPRHTPQHGEDWAIDPAFLFRVLHSIDPDTPCDFTPSPEQIESTLLALEVIPASIYTHSQNLNCKSTQARLATLWGYEKPQPPRQPLTPEAVNDLWIKHARSGAYIHAFARAIERAHGIGDEA